MELKERLRLLASTLPPEGSVSFTRRDLLDLLGEPQEAPEERPPDRDLTVEEVAADVGRAPSTVRGWLIAGALTGYKLNRRDWRIPRVSLDAFLLHQADGTPDAAAPEGAGVNIGAWRHLIRRAG